MSNISSIDNPVYLEMPQQQRFKKRGDNISCQAKKLFFPHEIHVGRFETPTVS